MTTAARSPRYERRDVRPRAVVFGAVGLFLGIGLSIGLVVGLLTIFERQLPHPHTPPSAMATVQANTGPKLELKEGEDRPALEAAAEARLHGYAWADAASGKARIPLERAMELQVRQGWPDDKKGAKP